MYPVLPFGPVTIPTGPVIILIAVTVSLEVAGRYGRRLGLQLDHVWNVGLFGLLSGLIVARLWNVIQFWPIYIAEPFLIVSIRPGGFELFPGLIAGVIVAYIYMLYHALAPLPMVVSLAMGGTVGLAIVQIGLYLTGNLVGTESHAPWALTYFNEQRHPVALYYFIGFMSTVFILWSYQSRIRPRSSLLFLCLGIGLTYLLFSVFVSQSTTIGGLRIAQFGGFALAIVSTFLLARQASH